MIQSHQFAHLADETSKVEAAVHERRLVRMLHVSDRLHQLPHPVFATASSVRVVPAGELLFHAGIAYHRAHPEWRDYVGFVVDLGRSEVGAAIRTIDDPVEGLCHIVFLGHEESE